MRELFQIPLGSVKKRWRQYQGINRLRSQFANYNHSRETSLCLFADPRSGSTWFTHLLRDIPGSMVIDEPLWRGYYKTDGRMPDKRSGKLKRLSSIGFYYYQPIPEEDDWPEAKSFFSDLLDLKIIEPSILQDIDIGNSRQPTRFIFKFNYGKLLFPWFIKNFDIPSIILVRHPCAVVASQLEHFAFKGPLFNSEFIYPELRNRSFFDQYSDILKTIRTPEENLAAIWAMGYLHTVGHPHKTSNHLVVCYEALLTKAEDEWKKLSPLLPELPSALPRNFNYYHHSFHSEGIVKPDKQLSIWRNTMTSSQIEKVLSIVHRFGITSYTDSLEPDYSQLHG